MHKCSTTTTTTTMASALLLLATWMAALALGAPHVSPKEDQFAFDESQLHNGQYVHELFTRFVRHYGKNYASLQGEEGRHHDEFQLRKQIFTKNLYMIQHLNSGLADQGSAVYGVNELADRSEQEIEKTLLSGLKVSLEPKPNHTNYEIPFADLWAELLKKENKTEKELIESVPKSVDWRQHKGVVSPVKNQGICGSCWAFSVTGNLEGQFSIVKNLTVSLSEQELVDCDVLDKGCEGGLPTMAYQEIIRMGGVETEKEYPYEGLSNKCHIDKTAPKYQIYGYTKLPQDEDKMMVWLAKRGPISVGINANMMRFYKKGVAHPWKTSCDNDATSLNHGVLVVGYGVENNKPYWIVKNSWGPIWGEKGYYRVFRGDNTCGVADIGSTALVR